MKKGVGILISLLLFLIIVGTGFYIHNSHKEVGLDVESKAFVDDTIPKIITNWDVDTLYNYIDAVKMLQKGYTRERMVMASNKFRNLLGPLKKYNGSTGSVSFRPMNGQRVFTAQYTVSAEFEKGPAYVDVGLAKYSGKWLLEGFNVRIPKNRNMDVKQ